MDGWMMSDAPPPTTGGGGGGAAAALYPAVVIGVDPASGGNADVTLSGGIGYVPVTFSGLAHASEYELKVDGVVLDQSEHGNDFWQTDYDAVTQTWSHTYNLPRPDGAADAHLEFVYDPVAPSSVAQRPVAAAADEPEEEKSTSLLLPALAGVGLVAVAANVAVFRRRAQRKSAKNDGASSPEVEPAGSESPSLPEGIPRRRKSVGSNEYDQVNGNMS